METAEKLKLVLEKMVVPHYDNIDGVDVKVLGGLEVFFYEVRYFYSDAVLLYRHTMREVIKKTVSLFNMLGVDKSSDITVLFVVSK